jgi:hypothetical protein
MVKGRWQGINSQGNHRMAGNGDMDSHRATYESVIGLMKWGAVACFAIAFIAVWLIVHYA